MVENFKRAWETKKIVLHDLIGFAAGTYDPSVVGHDGLLGSRFYHPDGTVYIKTGLAATDWTPETGSGCYCGARRFPFYGSNFNPQHIDLAVDSGVAELPFWKADDTQDNLPTDDGTFPFTASDGTQTPIPLLA